ncbi:hypothetical protein [Gluconobacter vitians]|uniref:hypothetical protein n=1 Tax=Gluconobacter vitians TaxID=2728102 RepID=UPI001D17651B|nr:hypothetical protein [Gluconobacter vitians]
MSRFVRFLVCGVALCALGHAGAADAPGWMQPLTLGAEAQEGEHLQTAGCGRGRCMTRSRHWRG